MEVRYRRMFLKDLKQLEGSTIYEQVWKLVFEELVAAGSLQQIPNVKAMKGHPNRYRIRIGNYRVGIEVVGNQVECLRVLHRGEFYRYFP